MKYERKDQNRSYQKSQAEKPLLEEWVEVDIKNSKKNWPTGVVASPKPHNHKASFIRSIKYERKDENSTYQKIEEGKEPFEGGSTTASGTR